MYDCDCQYYFNYCDNVRTSSATDNLCFTKFIQLYVFKFTAGRKKR